MEPTSRAERLSRHPTASNSHGLATKPSLYHQLTSRLMECDAKKRTRDFSRFAFLPQDAIDETITLDIVKANSSWTTTICNPSLPRKVVERARKVYAILGLCEEEALIWELFNEGLTDEHLPLARLQDRGDSNILVSSQEKKFTSFAKLKKNLVVENFLRKQWFVLAPVISAPGQEIKIQGDTPFPFYDVEKISPNIRSTVFKGKLHGAHLSPRVPNAVEIAIKDYIDEKDFVKEKKNLRLCHKLNHPHLIKHTATFQQGNLVYVVFPWADGGNLSEFWKRDLATPQTRNQKLFRWSFEQMFGLVGALRKLHKENCRHGDLKPENILHFLGSNDAGSRHSGYGSLVMADVGISKVHTQATELRNEATNTNATTPCYEAPETEFHKLVPRSRRYDMWSVGCMFMEFTIWLLYGYEAIDNFRELRKPNDDPFPQKAAYYKRTLEGTAMIHPAVTHGLEALRNDPRCRGDTALAALIELVADGLLLIDENKRVDADQLSDMFSHICQRARSDPSYLFRRIEPPPMIPDIFTQG